jgi:hypothetical protein
MTSGVAVAANPWPSGVPELKGKVQAVIVVGDVQLIGADGHANALSHGDTFEEGNTVLANKGGNAILVFSNGATLKVKEDTLMTVAKFRQAPYDQAAEGTFLQLNRDPSRSNVEIKTNQEVQGEVKKLDVEAGSTFDITTPKGTMHLQNGERLDGTATGGLEPNRG